MSENGSHVTWRELNLALEPIKDDIGEIKTEAKALRGEMQTGFKQIADSQWLGPQGRTFVAGGALLLAVVSIAVGFLH